MPSERKIWTRSKRLVPTARAMPISGLRSAASITKIMKISRMPAALGDSPGGRAPASPPRREAAGAGPPPVFDDGLDAELAPAAARDDRDRVARPHVKLLGGALIDVDLARSQVVQAQAPAASALDVGQGARPPRVQPQDGEQGRAQPLLEVHGDGQVGVARHDGVDLRVRGDGLDERRDRGLREALLTHDALAWVVKALVFVPYPHLDHLVHGAEERVRLACYAAVDGVAGGEGGGDDNRAEHEADDDEGRLGLAPRG